jgi:hypothetical protein
VQTFDFPECFSSMLRIFSAASFNFSIFSSLLAMARGISSV